MLKLEYHPGADAAYFEIAAAKLMLCIFVHVPLARVCRL